MDGKQYSTRRSADATRMMKLEDVLARPRRRKTSPALLVSAASSSVVPLRSALKRVTECSPAPSDVPSNVANGGVAPSDAEDSNSTAPPRLKRLRFEEAQSTTVLFNHVNPPNTLHSGCVAPFDYTAVESEEKRQWLVERLKSTKLSADETHSMNNHQQAFNIFSIPVTLDTKLLSVKELVAELKVRGLSSVGPKARLIVRLDKAILLEHPSTTV